MGEKAKSFPLVTCEGSRLDCKSRVFFYDQEREICHVDKSQVIFRNTRYKVQ